MTVVRHYIMHAAEGQDATLEAGLRVLADSFRGSPGCEGVELLRDRGNARRFLLIERWNSVEAHKDAGKQLPKTLTDRLATALDRPADGAYFDNLLTA